MKIAIIGGGFTGLAAGVDLVDNKNQVTIFESEEKLGGLGVGFDNADWDWKLEKYYHHIFANDAVAIEMATKVGLPPFFRVPKTNSLINGIERQLDSPISLLKFSDLSLLSRIHMGCGLLLMKLIPNGVFLEKDRVIEALPKWVGQESYKKIWQPLLMAKFGPYLKGVNLAWFWARIYKRTQSLGYFEGGYQNLAEKMGEYVKRRGGEINLGVKIKVVKKDSNSRWLVDGESFDKVLITTPAPLVDKLIGPDQIKWPQINYLWAQTMVLELEQSLMRGYWLNILEKDFPFMVMVEHTNFADKKHYGGKTIVYLGNYLPETDGKLKMNEDQLLKLYLPYIKKINPSFDAKWIKKSWCFKSPFAQPVFPINYSKQIPSSRTNLAGLFVANMSMVYPWDRGTNFAIELGRKAVGLMKDD